MTLPDRFRSLKLDLPLPGGGSTPARHARLFEIARQDVSLARLAEAHVDAVAILDEAGIPSEPGILYGVWAAEIPGTALQLEGHTLSGTKTFCSGAGIVDRALVTVGPHLLNVDLRGNRVKFDHSGWLAAAFKETGTAAAHFHESRVNPHDFIGGPGWYLQRPGFWQGACGPAACWAGGAAGLLDYARTQKRNDPHTLAHLGAMSAEVWGMQAALETAGREMDSGEGSNLMRALTLRHLIERGCAEILQRFGRAYGPRPLAFDAEPMRRYQEVELYIRQSHAERDLESLGRSLLLSPLAPPPRID